MFDGVPIQPIQQTPEREPEPISNEPTPKSKKEPVGRLANNLIDLTSQAAHLMLQSHLIHLNYEGSNFFGIHKFFKTL